MPHKEHYRLNLPHFQQPGQAYFVTWCLKDAVPQHALKRYTEELKLLKSQIDGCIRFQSDAKSSGSKSGAPGSSGLRSAFQSSGLETGEPVGKSDWNPILKAADWNRQHPGTLDSDPIQEKLKLQYYTLRNKYIKTFNDLLDAQQNPSVNLSKAENTQVLANALTYWEDKKLKIHAFCIMPNHVHWVLELLENDFEGKPVYLEDVLYSVKRFMATQINKLENRSGALWQKESFETTIRDHKHLYHAIEYTLDNPVHAGLVKNRGDWPGLR